MLDIKEAFQELDVEVIMELYQQANRNKQVLFEMCLQMQDPENADPNNLREAMQADQQQDDGYDQED